MTLSGIDQILADQWKDWRVAAAAPGVRQNQAALPQAPLTAADMPAAVEQRLSQMVGDEQRFVVDVESKQARIPPAIWHFRDRIIADYNNRYGTCGANLLTALMPYFSGLPLHRLHNALGYAIVPGDEEAPLACTEDP